MSEPTRVRPADEPPTLVIPAAAVDALLAVASDAEFYERDHATVVGVIATPVLAAEFRRFADIVPVGPARTILLNRADELDGGGA